MFEYSARIITGKKKSQNKILPSLLLLGVEFSLCGTPNFLKNHRRYEKAPNLLCWIPEKQMDELYFVKTKLLLMAET